MTKLEIAQHLSKRTNQDLTTCLAIVDNITSIMAEAFQRGENIYLRGFGTYQIVTRKQKIAQNITRHCSVVVPEHRTIRFKPSKQILINS